MQYLFTNELNNKLVDLVATRAKAAGFKPGSIKFNQMQTELFIGATATLDHLNGGEKSSMPPAVFFAILRGDVIEKREIEKP
jgi:hypothetical protein